MARNFTGTATTSAATLTITDGFANEVYAKNTGSVDLLVSVTGVHGTDDFDTIEAGDTEYYGSSANIGQIKVKTSSSTTTYTAGVTRGTAL
jgi:hypothetical protein